MSEHRDQREAWAVLVNSDLTEGRGYQYVKHICAIEATAVRLAHAADVQGSNGTVTPVTLERRGAFWLGPVEIEGPSEHDRKTQIVLDKKRKAEKRARELGLTDAEIRALRA